MFYLIKLIKIFSFTALVLIFLLILLLYFLFNKSIPDYNQSYKLSEPFGSIKIIRDHYAVPHIFATDNRDLFFGLGFVHAQDRLWQMILTRRFAYGNLSEALGEKSLSLDDFMRRMDIKNLSRLSVQFQSQRTQEALESYAQGVNSWLNIINENSLGRGSPEFFLNNLSIKKWEPVDSLSILRMNGLLGSSQLYEEALMLKTFLKIGNKKAFDLFSQSLEYDFPLENSFLNDYKDISYSNKHSFDERLTFNPITPQRHIQTAEMISITPDKTVKAGSLMSHNIHTKLTSPGEFMLARMEFLSGGVIGISIPGVPVILSGKNTNIAWGLSLVDADQVDLYIEELNPDVENEYRTLEEYKPLRTRNELIKIKGKQDKNIMLNWTDNGPIVPAYHFGLKINPKSKKQISLSSNAIHAKDLTMTASIDLMLSKSVVEALEVSKNYSTPIQNLMVIDKNNIAMKMIGKIPKRHQNHDTKGQIPSLGWKKKNKWKGYFAYEINPVIINPSSGYILNTGNKITEKKFPLNITHKWYDTQKILRLRSKMKDREIHTTESLIELQSDTVSYTARSILGLVAHDLWYEGSVAPKGSTKHSRQNILKKLSSWNGEMRKRSFEPIVYQAWLNSLSKRIIQDDLGSLYNEFENYNPIFIERIFKNINDAQKWCDITQTKRIENCQELAKDSLNDTITSLSEKYGNDINNWNWEKINRSTNYHNPLGANIYLSWLFNIVHKSVGGEFTLRGGKTIQSKTARLNKSHGSVYKGIYDLAESNNNMYILSTGQSGHFISKHYDDLSMIWRHGEYIPMSLSLDSIRGGAVGTTYIN